MPTEGKKKINVWVPLELWYEIEQLGYNSPTKATIEAYKALVAQEEKGSNDTTLHQSEIKVLTERCDGLQVLIEEKDKRIQELTQYKEDLGTFAKYFRSIEPKQIERENKKKWFEFWK